MVASHSTGYSYTKEIARNTNNVGAIWQDQVGEKYSLNSNQLLSDWQLSPSLRLNAGASYNSVKGMERDRRENYFSLAQGGVYNLTGSNRNKRFFSELDNSDINVRAALVYALTTPLTGKTINGTAADVTFVDEASGCKTELFEWTGYKF